MANPTDDTDSLPELTNENAQNSYNMLEQSVHKLELILSSVPQVVRTDVEPWAKLFFVAAHEYYDALIKKYPHVQASDEFKEEHSQFLRSKHNAPINIDALIPADNVDTRMITAYQIGKVMRNRIAEILDHYASIGVLRPKKEPG